MSKQGRNTAMSKTHEFNYGKAEKAAFHRHKSFNSCCRCLLADIDDKRKTIIMQDTTICSLRSQCERESQRADELHTMLTIIDTLLHKGGSTR